MKMEPNQSVIKILFYRWQTLKCTPLKIKEAQLKQLWQVICCVCQVLMVITKAFRMQFLICCGHDHKTKSQLGFSSCYFVSIQPVGNILLALINTCEGQHCCSTQTLLVYA